MATPLPMPKLGLTMEEGTILKWRKGEGEAVEKGEIILDIQTDKVEYEVESPGGGLILKTLAGEGAVVPCGTDIAVIGEAGEDISGFEGEPDKAPEKAEPTVADAPATPPPAPVSTPAPAAPLPAQTAPAGRVFASPAARRVARELGIDYRVLTGSGPGGRIVQADVRAAAASGLPAAPAAAASGPAAVASSTPLVRHAENHRRSNALELVPGTAHHHAGRGGPHQPPRRARGQPPGVGERPRRQGIHQRSHPLLHRPRRAPLPGRERSPRRKRPGADARCEHRGGGSRRSGTDGARHPGRRPEIHRRHLARVASIGRSGPRGSLGAGCAGGRHLHGLESGRLRGGSFQRHHQPPRIRHTLGGRGARARRCAKRRGRGPDDGLCRHQRRPPSGRRRAGGRVPGHAQGHAPASQGDAGINNNPSSINIL